MLSRNNKILIGCLALLLVMSVGYALFSDTITINGTATAKGEFDITSDCYTGVASGLESGFMVNDWQTIKEENGYKNDSCLVVDDTVSLNVEFEYPGALRYFTVKFTNTGSISAKAPIEPTVKNLNVCYDSNEDGSLSDDECAQSASGLFRTFGIAAVQVGEGSIVPYNEITSDLALEFIDTQGNYILKPGNSMYAIFEMGMSENFGSDDGGKFMMSTDFTFEFPFEQVTN